MLGAVPAAAALLILLGLLPDYRYRRMLLYVLGPRRRARRSLSPNVAPLLSPGQAILLDPGLGR